MRALMTTSILLLLSSLVPTAAAEWRHSLTPYVWAVGQDGDTGVRDTIAGDLIASYDLSPGDILDRLDGAFLLAYRGERDGRWGVFVDAVYMDLTDDGTLGTFLVDVDASQLVLSAAYTRAVRADSPWWWFAGACYVDVDNTIAFIGSGPIGIDQSFGLGDSWVDPFLGATYRRPIGDRWQVNLLGQAGGFGVGSDVSYEALVEAEYGINDLLRLRFGYRLLGVDYDDGFVFDTTSQGLVVGLTFGW